MIVGVIFSVPHASWRDAEKRLSWNVVLFLQLDLLYRFPWLLEMYGKALDIPCAFRWPRPGLLHSR